MTFLFLNVPRGGGRGGGGPPAEELFLKNANFFTASLVVIVASKNVERVGAFDDANDVDDVKLVC